MGRSWHKLSQILHQSESQRTNVGWWESRHYGRWEWAGGRHELGRWAKAVPRLFLPPLSPSLPSQVKAQGCSDGPARTQRINACITWRSLPFRKRKTFLPNSERLRDFSEHPHCLLGVLAESGDGTRSQATCHFSAGTVTDSRDVILFFIF